MISARTKKTQSKIKALEWSQHNTSILRRASAANADLAELQTHPRYYMFAIITCKNKEDPIKSGHNLRH